MPFPSSSIIKATRRDIVQCRTKAEAQARSRAWGKSLTRFEDALSVVSIYWLQESLPADTSVTGKIDDSEYGEQFRRRCEEEAIVFWAREKVHGIAIRTWYRAWKQWDEELKQAGIPKAREDFDREMLKQSAYRTLLDR